MSVKRKWLTIDEKVLILKEHKKTNASLRQLSENEELLAPRPTPNLEDHSLSAVRDCLFNIFAATLHIWRPFLHNSQLISQIRVPTVVSVQEFCWKQSRV